MPPLFKYAHPSQTAAVFFVCTLYQKRASKGVGKPAHARALSAERVGALRSGWDSAHRRTRRDPTHSQAAISGNQPQRVDAARQPSQQGQQDVQGEVEGAACGPEGGLGVFVRGRLGRVARGWKDESARAGERRGGQVRAQPLSLRNPAKPCENNPKPNKPTRPAHSLTSIKRASGHRGGGGGGGAAGQTRAVSLLCSEACKKKLADFQKDCKRRQEDGHDDLEDEGEDGHGWAGRARGGARCGWCAARRRGEG